MEPLGNPRMAPGAGPGSQALCRPLLPPEEGGRGLGCGVEGHLVLTENLVVAEGTEREQNAGDGTVCGALQPGPQAPAGMLSLTKVRAGSPSPQTTFYLALGPTAPPSALVLLGPHSLYPPHFLLLSPIPRLVQVTPLADGEEGRK